jgi:hypothetical protein
MFPDVPALSSAVPQLEAAGEPGGVCAAASVLDQLVEGADDAAGAAGWPFFGQLIGHDITADRSPVGLHANIDELRNARSPKLNLEMLYGEGPVGQPYLYQVNDPARLLTGPDGWDVPRNSESVALISDPRNDVHRFINRLHVALLHAHNGIVARLREDALTEDDVFDEARRTLTWHYQWVVVNDYLPRVVDASTLADLLARGGRYFAPAVGEAFLPLEFADAAFRYGHGQIRHTYRLQAGGPALPLFPDLMGFGPVPVKHRIDFSEIFDLPGLPPAQRAKRLDGTLAASLIGLPRQITGQVSRDAHRSLAVRDLLRGDSTSLPSGEAIAARLQVPPLTAAEVGPGWDDGTPLWFYILKEAQHRGDGNRLGPVGSCIVAEVLLGLLRADPHSYLSANPRWRPTLPARGESFVLTDLLLFSDAERNRT